MNVINYKNISDAIEFYESKGFKYIETPWYVTEEVMSITRPKEMTKDDDYYIKRNDKYLVASGEQSFIYLIFKGQIPPGFYQTVTPCYRFESINSIHHKCFMKNELIYIGDNEDITTLEKIKQIIILNAVEFFENKLKEKLEIVSVPLETSINNQDIIYNGTELGSYGIRSYKSFARWVYGTGCAEPRLSQLQKNILLK